jgi:hypothetical protein
VQCCLLEGRFETPVLNKLRTQTHTHTERFLSSFHLSTIHFRNMIRRRKIYWNFRAKHQTSCCSGRGLRKESQDKHVLFVLRSSLSSWFGAALLALKESEIWAAYKYDTEHKEWNIGLFFKFYIDEKNTYSITIPRILFSFYIQGLRLEHGVTNL